MCVCFLYIYACTMVLNYVLLSFSTWNSSNSVPFSPPYLWPIWKQFLSSLMIGDSLLCLCMAMQFMFLVFLFLLLKDVISISTIYKVCSPALRATHGIRGPPAVLTVSQPALQERTSSWSRWLARVALFQNVFEALQTKQKPRLEDQENWPVLSTLLALF